jgi:hypothetical protein
MNPAEAAASDVLQGFEVEVQSFTKEQLWAETFEDEDMKREW